MTVLKVLAHNLIAHPIAGVLWALGFECAGDRIHQLWVMPDVWQDDRRMTRHAKTREDLEPIAEARSMLLELVDALGRIDPTNPPPPIDEDYKIAEWHGSDRVAREESAERT